MIVFKSLAIAAALAASTAHAETPTQTIRVSVAGIDFGAPSAGRIASLRIARAARQYCESPVRHFGPSLRQGERACRRAINAQGEAAIRQRSALHLAQK